MIWLNNAWYVAGFEEELQATNFVARRFLDIPVVMFRHGDGTLGALEDLCPHRLLPLSMGQRKGDELQCGYHGLRFSVTGHCTLAPGQAHIPASAHVRTFPLKAEHGLLWIWLGNPALANPATIPDMHWNNNPGLTASRGYHHVQADFRLCVDNLMDLGHESWVHQRTIGNGEEECIPNYPVKVTIEAEGLVRCHREMPHIDPPPFFAKLLSHSGPIHRWQTALALAPSICMTDFGVYKVQDMPQTAFRGTVLHLLTPETARSTHYFWSVARNRQLDDAALTESIRQGIATTFDEDRVVLGIQQKQLDTYATQIPNVALKVDEAPMRARRQLALLIEREQQNPDFVFHPPLMLQDTLPELTMAR